MEYVVKINKSYPPLTDDWHEYPAESWEDGLRVLYEKIEAHHPGRWEPEDPKYFARPGESFSAEQIRQMGRLDRLSKDRDGSMGYILGRIQRIFTPEEHAIAAAYQALKDLTPYVAQCAASRLDSAKNELRHQFKWLEEK